MRARVHHLLGLLAVLSCSAPERANPAPRCAPEGSCPADMVCYRNFCVHEDEIGQQPEPFTSEDGGPVAVSPLTRDAESSASSDAGLAISTDGASQASGDSATGPVVTPEPPVTMPTPPPVTVMPPPAAMPPVTPPPPATMPPATPPAEPPPAEPPPAEPPPAEPPPPLLSPLEECIPICLLREITGKQCEKCVAKVFKGDPEEVCDIDDSQFWADRGARYQFCKAVCASSKDGCSESWCGKDDCGDDS